MSLLTNKPTRPRCPTGKCKACFSKNDIRAKYDIFKMLMMNNEYATTTTRIE